MNQELSTPTSTPYWQKLLDSNPETHEFLKVLAGAIYEREQDYVPLSSLESTDSSAAEKKGLVKRCAEEGGKGEELVSFMDESVRHDYLARHGATLLQEPWNEGGTAFSKAFERIGRQITRITGSKVNPKAKLLRVVAEERDMELLLLVRELAKQAIAKKDERGGRQAFWNLYRPFCTALPHLHLEAEEIIRNASKIVEAASGDLVGGKIYSAVEKMARQSKERALAFYEASVSHPEPEGVSLAANALIGLSDFDFADAHDRALSLTEEDQPILRRVGIAALGQLSYQDKNIPHLRKTWERLESLRDDPSEETDHVLVQTYGNLLAVVKRLGKNGMAGIPVDSDIGCALVEMASRPDPNARHMAVEVLFSKAEEYTSADWHDKVLLEVADTPSTHGRMIRKIDYCVSRCLEGDSPNPKQALGFLQAFVLSRPDGGKVHELLGTTLQSLQKNFFEELHDELTRWFSMPKPKLHRAASDIYQWHDSLNRRVAKRPTSLSKTVLDQISEQDVVWIVLRVCGYVAGGGELLASLVLSALRRDSVSEDLAEAIEEMLSEYVLYNYPQGGRKALVRVLEEEDVPEVVERTAREAIDRSERYYKRLRDLPHLKEFDPPSSRVYQLRRAQEQHRSEMMEQARNQSAFLGLASSLPLKYGKAFFSEKKPGEFTEPSDLGQFSHSFELPRGEIIDPVGSTRLRAEWQSVGLPAEDDPSHTKGVVATAENRADSEQAGDVEKQDGDDK